MKNFTVGHSYYGRFIGDSTMVVELQVLKRTAKTITAKIKGEREEKRLRISIYEGVEYVKPFGSYSMAPMVTADKPLAEWKEKQAKHNAWMEAGCPTPEERREAILYANGAM